MWPWTPVDHELARQRPAPAVLDRVAEHGATTTARRRRRSRAPRRAPAAGRRRRTVPSIAGPSSSEVISSAIEPRWSGMRGDELLDRDDEGGDRRLHVGRAAAVQPAVAHGRRERVGRPAVERTGRHDVGMSREDEQRPRRPAACPEVGDAAGRRSSRNGSRSREPLGDQLPGSRRRRGVTERRAISSRGERERRCAGRRRARPAAAESEDATSASGIEREFLERGRLVAAVSAHRLGRRSAGGALLISQSRLVGESAYDSASSSVICSSRIIR